MTSISQPRLSALLRALRACAPGLTIKLKKHHYWVYLNAQCYRGLPKGSGAGGDDPAIEFGHIRKLCRFLGISLECVERELGLRK